MSCDGPPEGGHYEAADERPNDPNDQECTPGASCPVRATYSTYEPG